MTTPTIDATDTANLPDHTSKGEAAANGLSAALKGIVNFASTDDTVPVLRHVQLIAEGETLTLVATDRYVAGTWRLAYQGEPFTATLHVDDCKRVAELVKHKQKGDQLQATLTLDGLRLTVTGPFGETMTVSTGDYDYPRILSLIPAKVEDKTEDKPKPEGVSMVALNPGLMAKFAKVVTRHEPILLSFTTARKPVRVDGGEHFTGVIMPMRIGG
jgi:DNA polymerase III sliding clamp (beta) subunit (PCNA family)